VGCRARALGRPLSRRAGRVGVTGRGLVGLPEVRALGALFPSAADVARSRSPVGRPVLPFASSLAYVGAHPPQSKLYGPDAADRDAFPLLKPALTRTIRWELIEQNYDQMIKCATAIRGTASAEAILRRFTRNASHPVYQAMLEVGRAQRTIFIARYLRDRDLQREINEGLNVVEAWNRVNGVIFFGKSGEFATNRRDLQELGMLALHILQAAIVYINTLMVQDVLTEPEWDGVLTAEDQRGLTPLFWTHILPYGEVKLNMARRLALSSPDTLPPDDAAS